MNILKRLCAGLKAWFYDVFIITNNQELDIKHKEEHFRNYSSYSLNLRTWLVAYGIGGPVLFITSDTFSRRISASPYAFRIVILFLLGVGLQATLAFINKYASYFVYVGCGDDKYQTRNNFKLWSYLSIRGWIDFIFDLTSLITFAYATYLVLGIFIK